jgi:hypothetical protein
MAEDAEHAQETVCNRTPPFARLALPFQYDASVVCGDSRSAIAIALDQRGRHLPFFRMIMGSSRRQLYAGRRRSE